MATSATADSVLVPPWPGEVHRADAFRLFVRYAPARSAPAEPAVFLHGLGGGATAWTDLMESLRGRLDCYAPDLPGFGHSPPPPDGNYGLAGQTHATIAHIETLGQPVHLCGNSLGGTIAIRVAATRPDLVHTLTLVSPALPDLRPRRAPAQLLVPLVPGVGPVLMRRGAALIDAEELARQNLEGLYGDPSRIHPQRLQEIADDIRGMEDNPHMQVAYLGALRGLVGSYLRRGSHGMWRMARRVHAPTLAFYGGSDLFINARMAARAVRCFPNCRVVMLSGVGHVAQMETPRVVADVMSRFLANPWSAEPPREDALTYS